MLDSAADGSNNILLLLISTFHGLFSFFQSKKPAEDSTSAAKRPIADTGASSGSPEAKKPKPAAEESDGEGVEEIQDEPEDD